MHATTSSPILDDRKSLSEITCIDNDRQIHSLLLVPQVLESLVEGLKCHLMTHWSLIRNAEVAFFEKTAFRRAVRYVVSRIVLFPESNANLKPEYVILTQRSNVFRNGPGGNHPGNKLVFLKLYEKGTDEKDLPDLPGRTEKNVYVECVREVLP